MFKSPNQKGMQILIHFLLSTLDPQRATKEFRTNWPILDRQQERSFRSTVYHWLSSLEKSGKLSCNITESQLRTCHGER